MKIFTIGFLSLFVTAALTAQSFAEVKVLTPEKGGTPNKVYDQKTTAPELTVATYNMAAGRVSNIQDVAAAIKSLDADIIALNEVDNKTGRSGNVDQIAELSRVTGMHGAFGKAIDFDNGGYGVGILSKYPIEKQQVFKLPSGDDEQRVLLVAEVKKPGFDAPILFMTTHLSWQEDPALRLQQIREIENITIGNTDSSFNEIASSIKILAGDFNDVMTSTSLAELQRYWNPLKSDNLDIRTWPAANPALDLDHIFVYRGQRWAVENMEIPNKQAEWKQVNWPATSDHVPVIAKIKLLEQ